MSINLHLPSKAESLRPSITVVGVGGAGGNAVNNMISSNLEGVNFVVANTDAQALEHSLAERRIQLGSSITRGLGAGAMPEVGRAAAEEALDEIESYIDGSNMVFIAAGMGGGTGTGAAPVVARLAKEKGILTVGIVTKPFQFEGLHRMRLADNGVQELQSYVDTLIVIPNQNLFRIINERTPFSEAFRMADEVLHSGVRGITDLIVMPGLINLDFADIRTVMREMGKAMMGTGEAEGAKRAVESAEAAIQNPLLDDFSMKGAKGVLINITGGYDMTLFEVDEAANRIRAEVDPTANIIFGATFNTSMEGKMRVSVVATGIEAETMVEGNPRSVVQPQAASTPRAYAGSIGFGRAEPQKFVRPATMAPVEAVREVPTRSSDFKQPVQQHSMPVAVAHDDSSHAPMKGHASENAAATDRQAFHNQTLPKTPFQEQPRAVSQSGPSFISHSESREVQPSFLAPQEDLLNFTQHPSEQVSYQQPETLKQEREVNTANVSMSFFQRMAKVKDALSSSPTTDASSRNIKALEKPKMELAKNEQRKEEANSDRAVVKSARSSSLDEDYLDIPAFLRRQAN